MWGVLKRRPRGRRGARRGLFPCGGLGGRGRTVDQFLQFAVLVHLGDDPDYLEQMFAALGERIVHVHVNFLRHGTPRLADIAADVRNRVAKLRGLGFEGSYTLDGRQMRVLRELYVSYRRPWIDLKVGKQQVAWGKMDGQFIDIVNAMDRREFVQLETEDYEWRRLPTWMANSTFYFGNTTVQLLYLFDFEHDRQPLPGSPWASPLIPATSSRMRPAIHLRLF